MPNYGEQGGSEASWSALHIQHKRYKTLTSLLIEIMWRVMRVELKCFLVNNKFMNQARNAYKTPIMGMVPSVVATSTYSLWWGCGFKSCRNITNTTNYLFISLILCSLHHWEGAKVGYLVRSCKCSHKRLTCINCYSKYYIPRQPWDIGNKIVHKNLVLQALQCQILCTKLADCSTFKHWTHHLSSLQFNDKETQNTAKHNYDHC